MISVFNILYGESGPYVCVEITALFGVISSIGSSQIVAFILIIGGTVATLQFCSAVVVFSRVTLPNRMNVYLPSVKSPPQSTQVLASTASMKRLIQGQIQCCVVLLSLVTQFTVKLVMTVASCEFEGVCSMACSKQIVHP
jgi:hypothetical protein